MCATALLSLILVQVESYAVSTAAIAPAVGLPYSLSNYASSSYTANVINRAIAAPASSSSLEAAAHAIYPDARYYNPFFAEQARIAAYGFGPQIRATAPVVPTAAPAATFAVPQSAAVAAPATTTNSVQADPVPASLAPTAAVPATATAPVVASANPSVVTAPVAAALPETAPAAAAVAAPIFTSNNAAALAAQFAAAPSTSYAYEYSRAAALPGSSYNLPYPIYADSS